MGESTVLSLLDSVCRIGAIARHVLVRSTLLMGVGLGLAQTSEAGHYTASFGTGGYTNNHGYAYAYGGVADSGQWGTIYGGYGSDSSGGTFRVTMTWVPDGAHDPAPKVVIVQESCTVQAAILGGPGTASANNGLGESISTVGTAGLDGSGNRINHYWQKSDPLGVSSFYFDRAPSASVTSVRTTVTLVDYQVAAEPPAIILVGGIPDTSYAVDRRFLMGQLATASLYLPFGLTDASRTWSISDGEPFKFWLASQSSASAPTAWTPTDIVPYWHFKVPVADPVTVSDAVHVSVPAGAKPVAGFDITVTALCTSESPGSKEYGAYMKPAASPYELPGYPRPPGFPSTVYSTYAYSYPSNGVDVYYKSSPDVLSILGVYAPKYDYDDIGIRWDAKVDTYVGVGTTPWGGEGGWNFVQKVIPGRHWLTTGGLHYGNRLNGQNVLDTSFPYDPGLYSPYAEVPNTFPATSAMDYAGDAPGVALGGNSSVSANESFETWLMYCPPGGGSEFVPIRKLAWYWAGAGSLSGTTWSASSTGSGWNYSGGDYPAFPQWTDYASAGDDVLE